MKSRAEQRIDLVLLELAAPGNTSDNAIPAIVHVLALCVLTRDWPASERVAPPPVSIALAAVTEAQQCVRLMIKEWDGGDGKVEKRHLLIATAEYMQRILAREKFLEEA